MSRHQATTILVLIFHLTLSLVVLLGQRIPPPPAPAARSPETPLEEEQGLHLQELFARRPQASLPDPSPRTSPFHTTQFLPEAPEPEPDPELPGSRKVTIKLNGLLNNSLVMLEIDGNSVKSFREGDTLIDGLQLLNILNNAVEIGSSRKESRTILYGKSFTFEIPR